MFVIHQRYFVELRKLEWNFGKKKKKTNNKTAKHELNTYFNYMQHH